MPPLKPARGIQLNCAHPLARDLGMCWLFNEGTGEKVYDLSLHGRAGALNGGPSWGPGKFGAALEYDGDDDRVETSSPVISTAPVSVSLWFKVDELPSARSQDGTMLIQRTVGSPYQSFRTFIESTDDKLYLLIYNSSGVNSATTVSDSAVQAGIWYHAVFVLDSNYDTRMFVNGSRQSDADNSGSLYNPDDVLRLGSRTGTADDFKGWIDHVMVFNRALSDAEVRLLHREPFCMFGGAVGPSLISAPPTVVPLAGSASSQSAASATLRSTQSSPQTQLPWLRDALFSGMSAGAFRLGTTLSLGWFWSRVTGCSALYRGPSLEEVDFDNALTVTERNACEISPPAYIAHDGGSACVYLVRRFNECGYQERTLAASVRVRLDSDGELEAPRPNKVFILRAEQVEGGGVRLAWFYCPLDQGSEPARFNVYYDGGTGRIDFENALATIPYQGRKYYSYVTAPLAAGRYTFAVSAADADGTEHGSSAGAGVETGAAQPGPAEVLTAGCI